MSITGKIIISDHLANKLGIPIQNNVMIRAGNLVVYTQLSLVNNNNKKSYDLSPELAQALYIKNSKKMLLRYDAEHKMLHLGPTVGIFAAALPNKFETDPTSTQAELVYLSNLGKTMPGQMFVFTAASINWDKNTTTGYTYTHTIPGRGVWAASTYPLPDAVYDRITSRRGEAGEATAAAKNRLMHKPFIKYFNPSFLDKWEVNKMLVHNVNLAPYLPETHVLTDENLQYMLQKYNTLFLKPSGGSLGLGIIKITKNKAGTFDYIAHITKRSHSQSNSAYDLRQKLKKYTNDRFYIVQQGIDLAKYQGSSFDLRIIYQKNNKGQWQISKKFVRAAPYGSSISNISRGGRVVVSKKVMRSIYNNKKELLEHKNSEIAYLCKTVAVTLEKASGLVYGELGLDIGIDKEGGFWLIEVNSKPRKTTKSEYSQIIMKNTFKRPLEYGSYLAGF